MWCERRDDIQAEQGTFIIGRFNKENNQLKKQQSVITNNRTSTKKGATNYFKKSLDYIFYSTPQIFEEIMALRHSLLTFKQVGCHCFLFIISLPLYYVYEFLVLNTNLAPKY